jgi:hypothetical protein
MRLSTGIQACEHWMIQLILLQDNDATDMGRLDAMEKAGLSFGGSTVKQVLGAGVRGGTIGGEVMGID